MAPSEALHRKLMVRTRSGSTAEEYRRDRQAGRQNRPHHRRRLRWPRMGQRTGDGGTLRRGRGQGFRGRPRLGAHERDGRASALGRRNNRDLPSQRYRQRRRRWDGASLRAALWLHRCACQQCGWLGSRRSGGIVRRRWGRAGRCQSQERLPELQARAAGDGEPRRRCHCQYRLHVGLRWTGSAQVAYAATKAGVIQLSRVVAVQYAARASV